MIITEGNHELIPEIIYIHDDMLLELNYNYLESTLIALFQSNTEGANEKNKYTIHFTHVIGFYCTSCDFWGPSPYVLGMDYVEKKQRIILPKAKKEFEKFGSIQSSRLSNNCNYIEISLVLKSGDKLQIACESIDISKVLD